MKGSFLGEGIKALVEVLKAIPWGKKKNNSRARRALRLVKEKRNANRTRQ